LQRKNRRFTNKLFVAKSRILDHQKSRQAANQ
jgi:hypothetical protein